MKTRNIVIGTALIGALLGNLSLDRDINGIVTRTENRTEEKTNLRKDKYQEWIDSTINWSKKNKDYAIVINKKERALRLYLCGTEVASYKVGLSRIYRDPKFSKTLNDKLYEGDWFVPEGQDYWIRKIKKKEKLGTKYFIAFELNFPTRQDSLEYYLAMGNGFSLGSRKGPGSRIEIHGGGNTDWTAGCIAMNNEDIADLSKRVNIETPVTIVKY